MKLEVQFKSAGWKWNHHAVFQDVTLKTVLDYVDRVFAWDVQRSLELRIVDADEAVVWFR